MGRALIGKGVVVRLIKAYVCLIYAVEGNARSVVVNTICTNSNACELF